MKLYGCTMCGPMALDLVDIFDPSTDTWTVGTPLAGGGRYHIAATSAANRAIFAGGYTYTGGQLKNYASNENCSAAVDIYNADTNAWSTATLPGGARYGIAATAAASMAIFAGGSFIAGRCCLDLNQNVSAAVDIYDSITDTWSQGPPLAGGPRFFIGATTIGTKSIFAGGTSSVQRVATMDGIYTRSSYSAAVDVYDSDTNSWSVGPPLAGGARTNVAAISIGTKAIFAGGFNGNSATAAVDIFDSITNTWSIGPSLAGGARSFIGATVVGDMAIFAGGNSGKDDPGALDMADMTDAVDIYDLSTNSWHQGPPLAGGARFGLAATTAGNKAIFAAGYSDTFGPTQSGVGGYWSVKVDIYNSSTTAPSSPTTTPTPTTPSTPTSTSTASVTLPITFTATASLAPTPSLTPRDSLILTPSLSQTASSTPRAPTSQSPTPSSPISTAVTTPASSMASPACRTHFSLMFMFILIWCPLLQSN